MFRRRYCTSGEQLDDDRLPAEYGALSARTIDQIGFEDTVLVEAFADVRFRANRTRSPFLSIGRAIDAIRQQFLVSTQICMVMHRRMRDRDRHVAIASHGPIAAVTLPPLDLSSVRNDETDLVDDTGQRVTARFVNRARSSNDVRKSCRPFFWSIPKRQRSFRAAGRSIRARMGRSSSQNFRLRSNSFDPARDIYRRTRMIARDLDAQFNRDPKEVESSRHCAVVVPRSHARHRFAPHALRPTPCLRKQVLNVRSHCHRTIHPPCEVHRSCRGTL